MNKEQLKRLMDGSVLPADDFMHLLENFPAIARVMEKIDDLDVLIELTAWQISLVMQHNKCSKPAERERRLANITARTREVLAVYDQYQKEKP